LALEIEIDENRFGMLFSKAPLVDAILLEYNIHPSFES
jgi:hypothetical protein